jgi:ATP-dependent Clp protease ATP-binding subunit ClpC
LKSFGITLESFRASVLKMHGGVFETQSPPVQISLTPRLKRVLANAKKEAAAMSHGYIGTETILLSILLETDGVPYRAFKQAGIDPMAMRVEILGEIQLRR